MNCQNHPDVAATAYCRSCGKPVCDQCRRDAWGTVYCAEHAPAAAPAGEPAGAPVGAQVPPSPYAAGPATGPAVPPPSGYIYSDVSPGLALFLGLIPGVGAIYNGQYAKGLLHAVIWGVLVSIINSNAAHGMEPIFGMLLAAWMAYMAFEAYHTARKRRLGEPVDEYSSLLNLRGQHNVPVVAIGLIVMGVLFLLHTLNLLDFEYVVRYWPVLLIAAGVYLLFGRLSGREAADPEVRHER
ncbi:MAG TPA: B-box zinc finger protein [Candidatus Acidoferrales bacterium]|nr:B-box zinc finger protein [Candidatus Acidoferrales bacterium]